MVRSEVLAAVNINFIVFWVVTPCTFGITDIHAYIFKVLSRFKFIFTKLCAYEQSINVEANDVCAVANKAFKTYVLKSASQFSTLSCSCYFTFHCFNYFGVKFHRQIVEA
jgi:hypothetical protein